jgi:5-methylcytosine-specific restriction protein A
LISKSEISREVLSAAESLGVQLVMSSLPGDKNFDYEIRISGIERPHGFSILVGEDYLSWALEVSMDAYGTAALHAMHARFGARKETLESVLGIAKARSKSITYLIDGKEISEAASTGEWSQLTLQLLQSYSSQENSFSVFRTALLDILCILLCLLVEDEIWAEESSEAQEVGRPEGGNSSQIVNKYERSRYNRALCLGYYGFTCRGCGILMENRYGPIGQNVIHVHHIVPISEMGESRTLDPIKDLVPLCPNCHNVVHRTNPPMPMAELVKATGYQPN